MCAEREKWVEMRQGLQTKCLVQESKKYVGSCSSSSNCSLIALHTQESQARSVVDNYPIAQAMMCCYLL